MARVKDEGAVVTRRGMLRSALWAGLGTASAGMGLSAVNYLWPRNVSGFGGAFTVPAPYVPPPGADPWYVREGRFFLVHLPPGGGSAPEDAGVPHWLRPAVQPSERGGVLALYERCSHRGCKVAWKPAFHFEGTAGWFRCSCHCSTFSRAGLRVFGPAPRSLDTMDLRVNGDGSVTVFTGKIHAGGDDNARRAVVVENLTRQLPG